MPLPSAWDTVPVFGAHVQINGEPAQGSITFTARQRLHSYADEIAILPGPITAFLGQDGRFEIALPTTDDPDITPSGWAWEVTEQFGPEDRPTYQRTYIMLAPAGDPIDLTNIEPAVPPEEAPVVPWTSVAGKTPNAEGNIVLSFGDLVGTVPTEAIPAIALTDVHTVDSEAAMLALDAQRGDMAIRLDESQSYVLAADDPTQAASWVRLATPPDVVSSVAGRTGHVMLTKADVGLDQVDNTSDLAKPVSAATQDALDAKVPTTRTVATGTGLTGGGDLAADRTLSVAFGTTAGTVAAGDDPRFAGGEAIQDQVDDHADTLAQHAAALGAPGYGTVRHSTTRPFGLDAQHAAFPGAPARRIAVPGVASGVQPLDQPRWVVARLPKPRPRPHLDSAGHDRAVCGRRRGLPRPLGVGVPRRHPHVSDLLQGHLGRGRCRGVPACLHRPGTDVGT